MIFHSENYGCQIGTGACRNLCPVQVHPGGFSAAWKIKFYVDSARKNFEQAQQRTSHKQDQEI